MATTQKRSTCTHFSLALKSPSVQICKYTITSTKQGRTKSSVFKQMFSVSARELVDRQMNFVINGEKPTSKAHGGHFDADKLLKIVATFLLATVSSATTWKDFSRVTTRKRVKHKWLSRLIKYLPEDLKISFNKSTLTSNKMVWMKSWMECHKSLSLTFALSEGQSEGLWQLFGHGLGFKQYQSLTNGKLLSHYSRMQHLLLLPLLLSNLSIWI